MSPKICFYFQVHQPYRLGECSFFDENYSFEGDNRAIFEKVSYKCYLPATDMLLEMLHHNPEFSCSFSLSGVFLEQCEQFGEVGKRVLENFQRLVKTGRVEILGETYYHSLSFLFSKEEYAEQIRMHEKKVKKLFGVKPRVFRNTELIFRNDIAEFIREMGFDGMLAEGWDRHLWNFSPNHVWSAKRVFLNPDESRIAREHCIKKKTKDSLPLLLKNYRLSDDIAFRFGPQPITAETFVDWAEKSGGETINLFMDFETIGEHQWEDTGIFNFFRALPNACRNRGIVFHTPSEAIKTLEVKKEYDVPEFLSWADSERDLSAWTENELQSSAIEALSQLEEKLHSHKKDPELEHLLHDFRKFCTSDHLYYMCTKYFSDGDVHAYFSPYDSPYEAYILFMNSVRSFDKKIARTLQEMTK